MKPILFLPNGKVHEITETIMKTGRIQVTDANKDPRERMLRAIHKRPDLNKIKPIPTCGKCGGSGLNPDFDEDWKVGKAEAIEQLCKCVRDQVDKLIYNP